MVGPRYVLEVSSPGLERPLRLPEHWRRFVGRHARVRATSLPGRSRVEILSVPDEEHVVLKLQDGSEVTVAFDAIREAALAVDWEIIGKRGRG
jgi:ribosome maturation factor RimP